jgi:Zn-dependent M28 family amino/carboxypeptidase
MMMMAQEVALLEIAEAFAKKAGHGPKRSILFLHVTGEGAGLGFELLFKIYHYG